TGVQTCALPISAVREPAHHERYVGPANLARRDELAVQLRIRLECELRAVRTAEVRELVDDHRRLPTPVRVAEGAQVDRIAGLNPGISCNAAASAALRQHDCSSEHEQPQYDDEWAPAAPIPRRLHFSSPNASADVDRRRDLRQERRKHGEVPRDPQHTDDDHYTARRALDRREPALYSRRARQEPVERNRGEEERD